MNYEDLYSKLRARWIRQAHIGEGTCYRPQYDRRAVVCKRVRGGMSPPQPKGLVSLSRRRTRTLMNVW
jgi:hypothetical protein